MDNNTPQTQTAQAQPAQSFTIHERAFMALHGMLNIVTDGASMIERVALDSIKTMFLPKIEKAIHNMEPEQLHGKLLEIKTILGAVIGDETSAKSTETERQPNPPANGPADNSHRGNG